MCHVAHLRAEPPCATWHICAPPPALAVIPRKCAMWHICASPGSPARPRTLQMCHVAHCVSPCLDPPTANGPRGTSALGTELKGDKGSPRRPPEQFPAIDPAT